MSAVVHRCGACGTVNYPPRALCRSCLSDALVKVDHVGAGTLLAATTLRRSFDPAYADRLPLRIGTVRLDLGPHLHVFLDDDAAPQDRVVVQAEADVWRARRA